MLNFKKYARERLIKSDIRKMTFMIIEDQIEVQLKIESDLKALGFSGKMLFSDSGGKTFKLIEQNDIDFILLDWNLKGQLTGLDILKQIRKHEIYAKIPVIMISAKNEVESILDAVQEGASDYLVKPWGRSELKEKIKLTILYEIKKYKISA